jgi:hypothetical protein
MPIFPATQEVGIQRTVIQDQVRESLSENPSQHTSIVLWYMSVITIVLGTDRRITVQR